MIRYQYFHSPLGTLRLVASPAGMTHIEFAGQHRDDTATQAEDDRLLQDCARQLREYFAGSRRQFDLQLAPTGTDFQQQVWAALNTIPYGEVRSYADIARSIKRAKAVRAVGAANGRNPLPIVVPCHRVIGSDGSLTGFAGGMEAKALLLRLEGAL